MASPQFESRENTKSKLPIYPALEPELILVEKHSALEHQIAVVRCTISATFNSVHARLHSVAARWIGVEHAVERRLKSIITPEEPLTPAMLYVGVATLTASVVARNRSPLLRFTLPPALFLLSMNHLLPQTSHNLSAYLWSLEEVHVPMLADTHAQISQRITSTSAAAREAWYRARDGTRSGVERGLSALQDRTGLKLRETLGLRQHVNAEATNKGMEITENIDDQRQ